MSRRLPLRCLLLAVGLAPLSCAGGDDGGRPAGPGALVGGGKDDGSHIAVISALEPGAPVTGELSSPSTRLGYVLYAGADSTVDLEVTHLGSSSGLDTRLEVFGPRAEDGRYPNRVASDDDSGFGALSRVRDLHLATGGHYLVQVTRPGDAAGHFRLEMTCESGDCEQFEPVPGAGDRVRWVEVSAEYRAAAIQAYAAASSRLKKLAAGGDLPDRWAVVFDADETLLSNVEYERARADLGAGFSSASNAAWVAQASAPAVPGAASFVDEVIASGGTPIVVTNRRTGAACQATADNFAAVGIAIEAEHIFCRSGTGDKNPRFDAVEEGTAAADLPAMPVVLYVGDNIQDFPDLTQEVGQQGEAALFGFGDRFILLPNPMYGSWESLP